MADMVCVKTSHTLGFDRFALEGREKVQTRLKLFRMVQYIREMPRLAAAQEMMMSTMEG